MVHKWPDKSVNLNDLSLLKNNKTTIWSPLKAGADYDFAKDKQNWGWKSYL